MASPSRADRFDLAIVGGGAAGCVLAGRLADRGDRRVVLIEAGPDLRGSPPPDLHDGWRLPKPPDWGFASEPDATGQSGKLRRGRVLGGTSWLTRFAVRGVASDFDGRAAAGNPGWAFDDVLPTFRRTPAWTSTPAGAARGRPARSSIRLQRSGVGSSPLPDPT